MVASVAYAMVGVPKLAPPRPAASLQQFKEKNAEASESGRATMEEGGDVAAAPPFPSPCVGLDSHSSEILTSLPAAAVCSEPDSAPPDASPPTALSDDLRDKIVKQVEYYFSDENLPTDKFLLKHINKERKGFVPIGLIASFRKMRKLVQDTMLIAEALKSSSQLVVSSDAKKVRRLHPLPETESEDEKSRTVLVENLPKDYSMENIRRIFGDVGGIKSIHIHDQQSVQESTKPCREEILVSGKLHALVVYETVEAADKAAKTLNDEKNWRSGMRVELLLTRMGKYGLFRKGWKKSCDDQNAFVAGDAQNVKDLDLHDKSPEDEDVKHLPHEKTGRCGQRRKGYQHQIGLGHGTVLGPGNERFVKPFPGPKMPDGTRGFSMGRGKHL